MYKIFTNAADYEYYTVSQNNDPPLTWYNFTYTVRVRQFLA